MSSVTFPSSGTNSTTSVEDQEQNFHHHDKRHKHKGHRSWGKGGGRRRQSTVPGYVWSDYFPVKAEIYNEYFLTTTDHMSEKEKRCDVQAKALLDNLRWVKGTMAAMGVGQKVLKQFGSVQHRIHVWAPNDQVVSNSFVVTHRENTTKVTAFVSHGENTKVTADVNLVGDAVAKSLVDYITPANKGLSEKIFVPNPPVDIVQIAKGYADVVGDVAAQRKKGSCSLKSEWKINESNVVAKAFRIFATDLDRKSTCGDKFSWQQAGRIWTEAMRNIRENASIFDFKCDTIMAAKKLYPFNKEIKFILVEAWKKAEAEVQTKFILNGKAVTELRFTSLAGGITGLTETATVPVEKIDTNSLSWLEKYFLDPTIQIVPEDKGTMPVTTVTYVFADGSQSTKYYEPQNLPENLQILAADPDCRKIGPVE